MCKIYIGFGGIRGINDPYTNIELMWPRIQNYRY
jgi:hypothetical protein